MDEMRPAIELDKPRSPRTKAQGISETWPGMNTPSIMQVNRVSEPRKRHFDRM